MDSIHLVHFTLPSLPFSYRPACLVIQKDTLAVIWFLLISVFRSVKILLRFILGVNQISGAKFCEISFLLT